MNERTHYFHADDLGRLELLHARYITHRFDRHVHSGYAIGVILAGAERFYYRGVQRHLAPAGSVVVVEPDEIHTGEAAVAAGWQYRMFYPQVELIQEIATELGGKSRGTPHFPEAVIHDQQVAGLLVQLHHTLDRSEDRLTRGSLARQAFGALLRRHARHPVTPQRLGAERAVVQRVRQYLLADLADNLSLDTLAMRVGMSPFHLLRVFRAATGQTPAAFRNQQRLIRAKALLRAGVPITQVALATGFSDQSHFTNRFKRMVGVPPGEYRRQRG